MTCSLAEYLSARTTACNPGTQCNENVTETKNPPQFLDAVIREAGVSAGFEVLLPLDAGLFLTGMNLFVASVATIKVEGNGDAAIKLCTRIPLARGDRHVDHNHRLVAS